MGNKINIEIADIAPILASLEKQNPFSVPDGYFSNLENQILDAVDKKPLLPHTAPEGYFDQLTDSVLNKIKSEEKTKVIPLYRKRWISIAAAFIVMFGAGYLIQSTNSISEDQTEFAFEIDPEEALEYLEENENLYLSDLMSLDIYEEDNTMAESELTEFDNDDFDEFLEDLDPEDLEDLL